MNALVGVRSNATGFLSANRAQREAAAEKILSSAKAQVLSKLYDPKTLQKVQDAESSATGDELGRDVFLTLLTTQLRYQDPLSPIDNTQMVSQLAQFSALEQSTELNDSFGELSGNLDQLNFITGGALLGRTVTGVSDDGIAVSGVVERVEQFGSIVYLTVNGQQLSMAGVTGIMAPEKQGASTGGEEATTQDMK